MGFGWSQWVGMVSGTIVSGVKSPIDGIKQSFFDNFACIMSCLAYSWQHPSYAPAHTHTRARVRAIYMGSVRTVRLESICNLYQLTNTS